MPLLLQHIRSLALRLSSARSMTTVASDRPLRVGIVGAGRIGQVHAQGVQRTSAVVHCIQLPARETEPARAERIAKKYGIPNWTNDASEVLSHPEIDAVLICSPTDKHAEQIIEAAKNKKHIFCEKPVDLELDVVNKAIKATEDAGVKLMIGFQRRFDANFLRIKEAIDNDEIGNVNMIRITSRDPGPPPVSYIKSSGGLFRDMTIHDFDMARFLVGDEVDEVYTMAKSVNPDIATAGDIDTAVVLLKFRNGVICYIENSREAAYGYDQRVEVLGSKGSVACDNNHANQVVVSTGQSVRRDLPLHFFLERYMDAYVGEMEAFIRVCTTGAPVPVGGDDGREALLLALAANKSLAENRPVKVDELRA
ncbi:Myo-inositol 2-dehydrogenase [Phytophthora cactorum]|uniref:Myo-inositol 2-dehydrogenase n=2 Tax=Phytophthora cactorum TaxID=29920 RepID=A0A8T1DJU3_9STRA|nr:Myo-inositol 2-dehydrogenase [Phytophthora cactorum]KAG2825155.1 Myo-inositol 2-dehydrogenase [Phytophthora cactorum]KAG2827108.1 Myo-inositol 2-dehydrogenase [Phytophthora cactorum]KAG2856268.1 Myo-inositol 2-dehydrogenase [Phytophthora cactorum]KAG2913435.1 Myo-inositol 2-dehydrogenase [Phytophthora cactorum]